MKNEKLSAVHSVSRGTTLERYRIKRNNKIFVAVILQPQAQFSVLSTFDYKTCRYGNSRFQ